MYTNLNFSGRKALAYIRKSTNDTNRQKYSIQSQREQIEAWCLQQNVTLIRTFKDDHSAKTFNRPGWNELVAYLATQRNERQADLLLVIDYSRFSRDEVLGYVSINQLDQLNIELQAIDQLLDYSIPESKFMRSHYMTMPAVDNAWRSIKVKRGMILSLREGNWCAGPLPRGYWKDKNTGIVEPTLEGRLIGSAMRKILEGYSIKEALDDINMRGFNTTFKTFSKILRNPFYAGKIQHKLLEDEIVDGKQEPVITYESFKQLQQYLDNNKKSNIVKGDENLPLKGFMSCPKCGHNYTGYTVRKKQKPYKKDEYFVKKSQPVYYKCRCSNVSGINAHSKFIEVLDNLSLRNEMIDAFLEALEIAIEEINSRQIQIKTDLNREIGMLEKKLERLEGRFIYDGDIDKNTYQNHVQKIHKQIDFIEKKRQGVSPLSNPSKIIDFASRNLTKIGFRWSKANFSQKKALQRWVFPEGFMYDKAKGQYLTPRINTIFSINSSFSVGYNKKTDPNGSVIRLWQSDSPANLTPLSNPSDHPQPSYIEDFISIEEVDQIFNAIQK